MSLVATLTSGRVKIVQMQAKGMQRGRLFSGLFWKLSTGSWAGECFGKYSKLEISMDCSGINRNLRELTEGLTKV